MTDIKEGPFIGDKSIREILGERYGDDAELCGSEARLDPGVFCALATGHRGQHRSASVGRWVNNGALAAENAPEPSPSGRSLATEKVCDHSGIGLPGCETCDPNTDRNQDRRRRGKSPVCIDCGSRGELVGNTSFRLCEPCDVSFGWMASKEAHMEAEGVGPEDLVRDPADLATMRGTDR